MKKLVLFLSALLVTFTFSDCQKKQYAYVQKGNIENFTHSKKTNQRSAIVSELNTDFSTNQAPTLLSSSEESAIATVLNTQSVSNDVAQDVTVMNSSTQKEVLSLSPSKVQEMTGKKMTFVQVLKLKALQKVIKKTSKPAAEGKSQQTALILACLILIGLGGIHRFYLGYTAYGIIQLLTAGGCGIWAIIDIINIVTGKLGPKDGSYTDKL